LIASFYVVLMLNGSHLPYKQLHLFGVKSLPYIYKIAI